MSAERTVIVNVDDHEPARYARGRILRLAGFTVYDAGTGEEALQLTAERQPEIVLLDVHLPDIHGGEVCRRLKSQGDSPIVIQLSASAISAPQATAALNRGADAYLIEPIDPDVLVATIRAFLRLRNAERDLAIANRELSEKNLQLQTLNRALIRSNEDLEHFAYVASHDLQEPLRNISTHIQFLERASADRFDEPEKRVFSFVIDGARRMSTLINDVLTYSRVGRDLPALKPVDLGEVVDWVLGNLSESITEAGASITMEGMPSVSGDFVQLGQVFQNLIGNSLKYRDSTRPLRVEISAEPDSSGDWLVRVRDNGIGIPAEYLDRIFRPFKRLHGYEIPGNGIGLALCRRIVEGHGGRIWAESQTGEGATFLLTLRPARASASGNSD